MHIAIKSGLCLAALAGGTILLTRPAAPSITAEPATSPVPVVAVAVRQANVPIVLNGLGTVQALNTATVRSQVTGVLQSVDFTEGQTVRKGDVLAQIDPRPYQAQLEQTQAQLGRDQAQLASTKVNLSRNLPLLDKGFATDQQVTDQRYQVAQSLSTLKFDQAAIDNAQTQLSYTTLTAPFGGVTGLRLLDVGNVIHPTDANGLVVVSQIQPISVVFTLPANDIGQVQDAMAHGTVQAIAFDQSGSTKLDTGQLLAANNQADPTTGTVQLKAVFPNLQRHLWPGTFVNVELTTSVRKNALTVPTDAVQQGPDGTYVYVVAKDKTVAMQPVQVAQRSHGEALVSQGLNPGETVVAQGQDRLTPGTVITASDPSQVADASTASSGMLP
jgi:membrane fusion protein, multidrug efflux system